MRCQVEKRPLENRYFAGGSGLEKRWTERKLFFFHNLKCTNLQSIKIRIYIWRNTGRKTRRATFSSPSTNKSRGIQTVERAKSVTRGISGDSSLEHVCSLARVLPAYALRLESVSYLNIIWPCILIIMTIN